MICRHPSFIVPARRHLPTATLVHITASLSVANEYFFPHVSGFSVAFPLLLTSTGAAFLARCKKEGKEVGVWTVNRVDEMCVASRLGCKWILTDKPAVWRGVRDQVRPIFSSFNRSWFLAYDERLGGFSWLMILKGLVRNWCPLRSCTLLRRIIRLRM